LTRHEKKERNTKSEQVENYRPGGARVGDTGVKARRGKGGKSTGTPRAGRRSKKKKKKKKKKRKTAGASRQESKGRGTKR